MLSGSTSRPPETRRAFPSTDSKTSQPIMKTHRPLRVCNNRAAVAVKKPPFRRHGAPVTSPRCDRIQSFATRQHNAADDDDDSNPLSPSSSSSLSEDSAFSSEAENSTPMTTTGSGKRHEMTLVGEERMTTTTTTTSNNKPILNKKQRLLASLCGPLPSVGGDKMENVMVPNNNSNNSHPFRPWEHGDEENHKMSAVSYCWHQPQQQQQTQHHHQVILVHPGKCSSLVICPAEGRDGLSDRLQEEPLDLGVKHVASPSSTSSYESANSGYFSSDWDVQRVDETPQLCWSSTGQPGIAGTKFRRTSTRAKQRNYKSMTRERRIEANARERTRVHTISAAFENLRAVVPVSQSSPSSSSTSSSSSSSSPIASSSSSAANQSSQKLSKLAILKIASAYIRALSRLVDNSCDSSEPGFRDCADACARLIESETAVMGRSSCGGGGGNGGGGSGGGSGFANDAEIRQRPMTGYSDPAASISSSISANGDSSCCSSDQDS